MYGMSRFEIDLNSTELRVSIVACKYRTRGVCRIHNETTCHELTRIGAITQVVDNTPYKACVCIYLISLDCIPVLQGQDASMVWEGFTPNCGCSLSEVNEKPLKHIVCTIYFHHAE